jgi:hypothetical protein
VCVPRQDPPLLGMNAWLFARTSGAGRELISGSGFLLDLLVEKSTIS